MGKEEVNNNIDILRLSILHIQYVIFIFNISLKAFNFFGVLIYSECWIQYKIIYLVYVIKIKCFVNI